MARELTKAEVELGRAHVWLSELNDDEFDLLGILLDEYGDAIRFVARAIQIQRNAARQMTLKPTTLST